MVTASDDMLWSCINQINFIAIIINFYYVASRAVSRQMTPESITVLKGINTSSRTLTW